MDAILKFKEAAQELQKDPRYLALQVAKKESDENEELQNMIGEFNLTRLDLNEKMADENRDDSAVVELNKKVNQLYNNIMGHEKMVAFENAKKDIEDFIEYVNAIINAAIDGQDPMQVEEPEAAGCSGSCGSCNGGCH